MAFRRASTGGAWPLACVSIALANVAVFVTEVRADDPVYVSRLALIPFDVTHGIVLAPPSPPLPVLTLLTAQFVHAGWQHLAGNLVVLALAGPAIERALGPVRLVAFYVLCGTAGSIACVAADPGSHVPVIGASGAIAGLLGAYLILSPLARVGPYGMFAPALFIGGWALAQFQGGFGAVDTEAGGSGAGTAYFAHIGGFIAGVVTIETFVWTRFRQTRVPLSRRSRS